jgi:uncharacterized protein YyaL (SSP411 family)
MRKVFVLLAAAALLTVGRAPSAQGEDLTARAEESLRSALDGMAARQVNGGWGMAWTLGGDITWGEWMPVPHTWICAQPPATPTIAQAFLDAGILLQDDALLARARMARDGLEAILTAEGGVPHEADPNGEQKRVATFDDGVTTASLEFLVAWWQHTGEGEDLALVHRVGNFILTAQYDSGGWPQRYPPGRGYDRFITFNDGVMADAIHALLMLHRATGEARYLESARKGGECIIRLQGGEGEAIWAQQYDEETLEPAWARNFEPPGYTPAESVSACDALISLYLATGEERFLNPLPKAFTWYETHRLDNGKYARLYEPGTQRPVYGRRDKKEKVYEFENACEGYSWQAEWYPHAAKAMYARIQQEGRDAIIEEQNAPVSKLNPASMSDAVNAACATLSEGGYWLSSPSEADLEQYAKADVPEDERMIRASDFVKNTRVLIRYLEAAR